MEDVILGILAIIGVGALFISFSKRRDKARKEATKQPPRYVNKEEGK